MESAAVQQCERCIATQNLLVCARCRSVYYCSREHQTEDWKTHKVYCNQLSMPTRSTKDVDINPPTEKRRRRVTQTQPSEYLYPICPSEPDPDPFDVDAILQEAIGPLLDATDCRCNMFPDTGPLNQQMVSELVSDASLTQENFAKHLSNISLNGTLPPLDYNTIEEVSKIVINDMSVHGICVVDDFLGERRGGAVLNEVLNIYNIPGIFGPGQLVNNTPNHRSIRSDQITWLDGTEPFAPYIRMLIAKVDAVITKANLTINNGRMGDYSIKSRSKAMVACYPGNGAHYVKHVDNPNNDGRCITAIYYLNKDWSRDRDGGLLRIFPQGSDQVANIDPLFDRILFFWSDRRNPHEVQPSRKTRFAITLWYFDNDERERRRLALGL